MAPSYKPMTLAGLARHMTVTEAADVRWKLVAPVTDRQQTG